MSHTDLTLNDTAAVSPGLSLAAEAPHSDLGYRRGIALVVIYGFLWAAMVWSVQYMTTAPTLWKDASMWIKDLVFRFLLDWSVATACFALFSTRVLSVLFAVNLWLAGAVLSFFVNYQRSLSWITISNQSGEGMAVALVALEDAAPYLLVLAPLSLLLLVSYHFLRPRIGQQKRVAQVAMGVWATVVLGMHFDHKPLDRLERFETADGIAHSYGYTLTWLAESIYVDYDGITENAFRRLEQPVDRLTKAVPTRALGDRLAVIQVESLDDALVHLKIHGREVTPRLNRWAEQGTYLRIQSPKINGSCDADFSLLFGALPSDRMAPYRIPDFPFNRSIVNVLHDRGITTSAYHGVNGTFFERRGAFEEMDFDRLSFREELIDELDLVDPEWTIEDGKLFDYATRERKNTERFFEFTITGTSHTPYRFSLEDHEREIFPESDERDFTYFDTIQYVDKAIGRYVDALPDGTVVIIYGDHFSRVENQAISYASELVGEFGIVPALLFHKEKPGASPLFEIDPALAKSTQLRLVDVTAWIRASLGIAPATQPYIASFSGG